MAEKTVPPSPNWYLSLASDANEAGVYVYAARLNVYILDVSVPSAGPRMLRCYMGHTERVSSVALSPTLRDDVAGQAVQRPASAADGGDGSGGTDVGNHFGTGVLCCSGGDDKAVKIWTVDTLSDVQSHNEHKDKVTSVSWSAVNTNLVASGDEKGEIIVWNRKSNTVSKWRQEKDYVYCTAFCPHEPALLAVGVRQGTVYLVDFSSSGGHLVHRLRGHDDEVLSLSWCPVPGETFLKESEDGTNTLADPGRDTSGCLIATGSKDRTIRVWSRSQGRQLFIKKLPNQRRDVADQAGRFKGWVAVHWLKFNPEQLVSSSSGGDLLLWNLKYTKGQPFQTFYCTEFRPHMRSVFNICASGPRGETLCTFAQDRHVNLWSVDSTEAVSSLPTLGGHVYCVRNSPLDPGRVAVGVGDSMIRVWNTSNKTNPYDVSTFWQGIKSKVTALAWHPSKEGWLGFGTDDGRVGVYDILSHKMPMMSGTFHHRTVYVLCWGPASANAGEGRNYSLYSVGDCKILEHFSAVLSRGEDKAEALNITDRLVTVNSGQLTGVKATEMSWSLDVGAAAVGCDDGSVYIVSAHGLKLLATIKMHKKLMNCTRWHPHATDESPSGSPCREWLVSGGNDQVLHVVDLSKVLAQSEGEGESVVITSSLREFTGHSQRITDICWSPHHDGRLVSVGYDAEAFVWDVQKGVALAQFKGHWGRVLTCQFSGIDPDLVLTGGSDSALMVWRVSQQTPPKLGEGKKKKRKKPQAAANISAPQLADSDGIVNKLSTNGELSTRDLSETTPHPTKLTAPQAVTEDPGEVPTTDLQHLQEMLDSKRRSLLAHSHQTGKEEGARPDGRAVLGYDDLDAQDVESLGAAAAGAVRGQMSHTQAPPPTATTILTTAPLATDSADHTSQDEDETSSESDGESRPARHGGKRGAERAGGRLGGGGGGGGGSSSHSRGGGGTVRLAKGGGDGDTALGKKKRRQRLKSYFPVTSQAENKGRAATYDDLLLLTSLHCGQSPEREDRRRGESVREEEAGKDDESSLPSDKHHLGLFTDRKGTYLCLQQELGHHVSHDNMEYALQMELWKGNISGAIQLARERAQLSDWIVSLAPLASYETWLTLCEEYAEQLEEEGQYHKAVSYLLASHKLYPAIDLFRRHRLFREAVALARVRLSPLDPVLEDLYTDWSEQLMRDGAYEQAAKCYLAMKHIQDAAQVITRRSDQSSLQAACHMTLVANEKQQGQLYAQQVVTRYLLNHQWAQCLAFLREHQPLKVFVPYVSVHEMVMHELKLLLPDMVAKEECHATSDIWDTTPADKLGIPEFILDPKEADPVLPWEPYLVAGHTFPHHVLRVWHLHLGVTMETEQLHLVYHALQQLQSGRQAHLDTQQVLLQVCVDITLWLLALLTNQTSLAISHLLGALSALHEGGHQRLLSALCRLILPQGPKYTLKLQQEVAALRVLINMESQVDVEGGGKHLSLRRYLSELKEEPSVSTGALRCKQLDCVRAYYYLSVLHFLQDLYKTHSQDACRPEPAPPAQGTGSPAAGPLSDGQGAAAERMTGSGVDVSGEKVVVVAGGGVQSETRASCRDEDGGATTKTAAEGGGCVWRDGDGGSSVDSPQPARVAGGSGDCDLSSQGAIDGKSKSATGTRDSSVDSKTASSCGPADRPEDVVSRPPQTPTSKELPPADGTVTGPGSREAVSGGGPWRLSLSPLLQLSKGLLWDVQAKRLALTDTLGHIHRAISQHLLTDHSREVAKTLSRHPHASSAHNHNLHHHHLHHQHSVDNVPSFAPVLADTVAAHLPADPLLNIDDVGMSLLPPAGSSSTPGAGEGGDSPTCQSVSNNGAVLSPPSPSLPSPSSSMSSSVVPSLSNADNDSGAKEKGSQLLPNLDSLPESNFDLDLVTLGQQWDGSRRVLWQDDPLSGSGRGSEGRHGNGDSSLHKPTSLLSPGKYINVPDEWYSLPVDEKYTRSYVTLAILKDEQDFVMGELKRMSDSSQVPFPNPFLSVESLLSVCLSSDSQLLSGVDKHNYVKSLQSWAMHFAVTSQQRTNTDTLFEKAEKDVGL